MKKILSIVLVLCMLATTCAIFSSCGGGAKVTVKDVEEKPEEVLTEAIQNASQSFFTDDAEMGATLDKVFNKGSVSLAFESDDLMGGFLTKVSETLYIDSQNSAVVSETAATMNGENLSALIFLNKNGVALSGESLLGSNKALALNFASFITNFGDSKMVELFQIPEEAIAELVDAIEMLKTELSKEQNEEEANKLANDLLKLMSQVVAEEKIEKADGKKADAIVVSYTLNNSTYKALMNKIAEKQELPEDFDEMMDEALEMVEFNLTLKLSIDKKTKTMVGFDVSGTVKNTVYDEDETVSINLNTTFSDTEISLVTAVTAGDDSVSVDAKITKTVADGKTVYKFALNATEDDETINPLNVTYSYEKSTGNFELALDAYNGELEPRSAMSVTGNIKVAAEEATISITSLKVDSLTLTFKLTLSFKALTEIPTVPADAMDITEMTEGQWVDVMNEFMESPIGQIIAGSMGDF